MQRTPVPASVWLVIAFAGLASVGCSTLLPTAKHEVVSDWSSYDSAATSLRRMEAHASTRGDVHHAGLDPASNPAVTMLHFGDVLQRFAPAALIEPADVERGIRDCLRAGKRCSGYSIAVKKTDRQRVGNFWLDSFNFKRETVTTGWSFEALLVFVDDLLVYQLIGGQPRIRIYELQISPLGPLQSVGDQMLQTVR